MNDREPARGAGPKTSVAILVALCVVVFLQAFTSLRIKSLTYDEVAYIAAGYSYVKTGDYRLNPEQPPLMKLLAGAAMLPLDPVLPTGHWSWTDAAAGIGNTQWIFGEEFLIHANPNGEELVQAARIPVVFVLMLLVIGSYLFARDLYGERAGLLAATLSAFSPNLLAHGRLATTDLGLACFVLLTVYAYHRFTRNPTPGRLALAGVVLGLALLTKFSAVLLLPLLALWAVALPLAQDGLRAPEGRWGALALRPGWGLVAWSALAAGGMVLVALLVVSLGYMQPGRPDAYLRDLGMVSVNVEGAYQAYFDGVFRPRGVPYYFVAAFLLKTPLAFLLLLGLRAILSWRRPPEGRATRLLLFAPIVVWLVVISWRAFQVGLRYVLPAYPLLFVFAAGIVALPAFERRWVRATCVALLAWFVISSVRAHPHYLPYFNELAGGPDNGIEWLDDSNVDWGQDLILLRDFLEGTGLPDVRVTPMAEYDMALYDVPGEQVPPQVTLPLLSRPDPPPGVYAVSVHLLNRIRTNPNAPVDPLTDLTPIAVLGHTIYVFAFP